MPSRLRRTLQALALLAGVIALAPAAADAAPPCDPQATTITIACENSKPGIAQDAWSITGAGDPSIQGFGTQMSVNKGQTISFKIKSTTPNYRIDILRLGYYGGDGARRIATNLSPTNTAAQPACQTFSDTGLIDCANWSVSRTWTVPSDAVSGVYIANLVRNDNGGNSHITFVVRDDAGRSDILVQTSDSTWQAYNRYGGNSLYVCTVACPPGNPLTYKAAFKVSYNRPFNTNETDGTSFLYNAEYPMIRFLERMGYDVSYTSQVDTESSPALIRNHKMFISSGHDEYWSRTQRDNVTAARDAGVNLAFFSGNEMFWKTRYENSNRTLVSYKDTHFTQQTDPVAWTGTWADPRFSTDYEPQNSLTGQLFVVNSGTSEIMVPSTYKNLRLWRNTAVTSLASGQSLRLGNSTLGYEWDEDPDNGFRPPGQFRLSSTTVSGLQTFIDYGSEVINNGTATHNLTTYRAPSGALVFGAGTVQWSWGLDDQNPVRATPDRNMQQATVNLFADMSAQPANTIPNVSLASKTTDTTRPTSTITTYPTSIADGAVTTLSGTATDGGGVVAGVEISTDGGSTWHPVTSGTSSWSHTWTAHGTPAATIKTRAVDDSGNIETPGAGRAVTVNCPCSVWGPSFPVPNPDSGDPGAIEVGMKFTSDKYGVISGVRFYKGAANTGTHTGSLWSASGTRLATATFTNETASGWQTVTFGRSVQILPNTTYVVSYYAPAGRYSATASYMYRNPAPIPQGGATHDSGPLHVVRESSTTRNGVFRYGSESGFPSNSFGAANYWVDVLFTPTPAPGQVTNVTATSGGLTSANVSWNAPSSGGGPTSYIVTPYVGVIAQTSKIKTVTGSPPATITNVSGLTNGMTYTFRVTASNPTGDGPQSEASNTVTPLTAVPPSAPRNVDAVAGTSSAKVTWTASEADGDSALTGYTITPYVGATAQPTVTVGPTTTSKVVTDLTNGTTYTFKVRASNGVGSSPDSGASPAVTPQSSIFDYSTPTTVDAGDPDPVELGVKFKASVGGSVTGVRFYKAALNTGTHVGNLWSSTGTLLASVSFTNESDSGWQTASFANPVAITAGTTYVVSYFAPKGRYSHSSFGSPGIVTNGVLSTISTDNGNGVYRYGVASGFPTSSYQASNYWVDLTFAVPPPGQTTGASATASGKASAAVSWTPPTSGGAPDRYIVTASSATATTVTKTVTGTPLPTSANVTGLTTGATYTFTVAAANMNGSGPASAASNAVTPTTDYPPTVPTNVVAVATASSARVSWTAPVGDGGTPITQYTVTPYIGTTAQPSTTFDASATSRTVTGLTDGNAYSFRVKATNAIGDSPLSDASNTVTPGNTLLDLGTPATSDSGDTSAINLGLRFTADTNGQVTGVRFYKDPLNTGTHVGALWNANGFQLAQVTFTNETASGWQSATFASPVSVTAGATYTVSYFAPVGRYSSTAAQFSTPIVNPPLRSATGPNGVYGYGSTVGFPANSFNATNYWVDVTYTSPAPPNPPTNVTATAGQGSADVSWTAPASGPAPTSYQVQPRVGGNPVGTPKTVSGSPPATSTTVTGLAGGTTYTFTVKALDGNGASAASAQSNAVTPTAATAPGTPTGVTAQGDSTAAIVRWTAPDNGGDPISSYDVIPRAGSSTLPATTVAGSATTAVVPGLTNGTSYTFTVRARNGVDTGPESAATVGVIPRNSIFVLAAPSSGDADGGDNSSVNLGVKFRSDVSGMVTGVRFYKSAANTGAHVGSLWSATGTLLAQGTFSGETTSGWQALSFATPVAIDANTTYVVSYFAPNGRYAATGQGFASAVDNAPLRGLADPFSSNGIYAYAATPVFPDRTFNAANYWVDVLFAPGA